ncbi:MAG: hypothetical protein ACK53X_00105 [Holosporales bacterium]
MAAVVIIWSFFALVFFKVTIDAGMNEDITVFATLLMAIVFGGMIFISTSVYATRLFYINAKPKSRSENLTEIIRKTIGPFCIFSTAFIIFSRLIVFGFSKELNRKFRWNGEEEFLWFSIFICIPLFVHYIMILFATYKNTRQIR